MPILYKRTIKAQTGKKFKRLKPVMEHNKDKKIKKVIKTKVKDKTPTTTTQKELMKSVRKPILNPKR